MHSDNNIIIYRSEDGETRIEVKFTGETVWLSQQQMADLYQTTRPNIVQHIRNIYADGELKSWQPVRISYRFGRRVTARCRVRFHSTIST